MLFGFLKLFIIVAVRMLFVPFPGGGENFFRGRMRGMPAEDGFAFGRRGDEDGGVSGAARFFRHFEIDARDRFGRFYHFADAASGLAAQIENIALAAVQEIAHGQDVSVGEIGDVDVIADAGAVFRRVIRAEDGDMVAYALRRFQNERDEMRLRIVIFADGAALCRPGRIEIAERDVAKAVSGGEIGEHMLNDEFRAAVDIGRTVREIFFNRRFLRLPVHGGGGGEDDFGNARFLQSEQKVERAFHIVFVIFGRVFHRFADKRRRGEMDDAGNIVATERLGDKINVVNVAADERDIFRHGFFVTGRKIIKDDGRESGRCQSEHGVRTDVAGTAGDKNIHRSLLIEMDLKEV